MWQLQPELSALSLSPCRQSMPLVVVDSHSSASELLPSNPILLTEVIDHLQLALLPPTSERNYHELG
jgi:hypothetical protein